MEPESVQQSSENPGEILAQVNDLALEMNESRDLLAIQSRELLNITRQLVQAFAKHQAKIKVLEQTIADQQIQLQTLKEANDELSKSH